MDVLQTACPIVCIGASAGGLEAIIRLLKAVPADSRLAYVVIQHLDPDHPSQLVHLLTAATRMPVMEAVDGVVVASAHVYVIPPNRGLTVVGGILRLMPRADRSTRHLPINTFLRSLTADSGNRSIAVVLSGGGDDGTLGIAEVRAMGGITFAQDASAEHHEMPDSAIASGNVDFVLAPDAIAAELARIAHHVYLDDTHKDGAQDDDAAEPATAANPAREAEVPELLRIIARLRALSGIDFAGYRSTMVKRRVVRRMALRDRVDLKVYADDVEGDEAEAHRLVSDLLIGVTSFFRDPEVFTALRTRILPDLIARKEGKEPLRVWVAGCSTGEEVYSLAIEILDLCAGLQSKPGIQIFATDVNDVAVVKARTGLYQRGIAADMSPERLQRYFVAQDGGYRVDKAVRDLCVFARHNLNVDTPFSRIDLISCRNVMIYFGPAMQERVLATFNHALTPGGFLMLGSSEGVGDGSRLFRPLEAKHRLFGKTVGEQRPMSLATLIGGISAPATATARAQPSNRAVAAISADLRKEADRIVLERFGPAGVLVDAHLGIIQFRGSIGPYLAPTQGRASLDLLKVVHPSLLHTLESTISQAREQDESVRARTAWFPAEGSSREVFIEVVPVRVPANTEECFLIMLEGAATARLPPPPLPETAEEEPASAHPQELPWMRQQLAATKQYLLSMIEQHDIANERMQLASDDLQSTNEELRVTNEEVQTAKEEQESANEELATLLEELRRRNFELSELNDDLTNLLEKITIPVIIIGADLRVRRITSTARSMNPGGAEVGRLVGELGRSLHNFDLEKAARVVMESGIASEHEACDHGGAWRSVRIFPYEVVVGGDRRTQGAVITVLDIDRLKRSEITLDESSRFTRSIVDTIGDPILVLDRNLTVVMANRAFRDTFHQHTDLTERPLADICDGEWRIPDLLDRLRATVAEGIPLDRFQVGRNFPAIGFRMLTINARAFDHGHNGNPMLILSMTDLTEQIRMEVESRRFKFISERSSDCHILLDHSGRYAYVNRSTCTLLDSSYEQLIALSAQDVAHQWPGDTLDMARRGAVLDPAPLFEAVCSTKDGRLIPMEGTATTLDLGDSHYILLAMRDVSARKSAEAELHLVAENLRRSNADLDRFAAVASHDLKEPLRMITNYLDLLSYKYDTGLDEKARLYINHAVNGAKRLSGMVAAILEYAQFERTTVRVAIDVGEALTHALTNLEKQIAESGAEVQSDPLPTVLAAPGHLDLVFQNLIGNALKYRSPQRAPTVKVTVEDSDACWTFSVADNGIGIAPGDFARAFDLFQRLNPHDGDGSGIGLATTRRIVDHHGGHIWLDSKEGVGSVFHFTLPKYVASAGEAEKALPASNPASN